MGTARNPFTNPQVARDYNNWYVGPGRHAEKLEKALLQRMLATFAGAHTALEVGCGTGHFTRWLASRGLQTVGVDISHPMLLEARRHQKLLSVRGNALALPFPERAFDVVAMVTTLEFVHEPMKALTEAVRVARLGLLLGVLNRCSTLAIRHRLLPNPIWRAARFFSPGELSQLTRTAAGPRFKSIHWRTTLWPFWFPSGGPLPWGGFIALAAELKDHLRG
jgi:ubiquinone/menaquinone biosynthesis C-methylase UbiE